MLPGLLPDTQPFQLLLQFEPGRDAKSLQEGLEQYVGGCLARLCLNARWSNGADVFLIGSLIDAGVTVAVRHEGDNVWRVVISCEKDYSALSPERRNAITGIFREIANAVNRFDGLKRVDTFLRWYDANDEHALDMQVAD